MKTYSVKIVGLTALMHHRMTEEQLFGLLGAKSGKKKDKVVRTPQEIAESHAYRDPDGSFVLPTSYLSGAFAQAAGDYKQTSSARKSYKSIAGGIFRPQQEFVQLKNAKGKPIVKFDTDVRKATNHKVGAVAVCRPRFDEWQTSFDVTIDEDLISQETAHAILSDAGKRVGVGSFRVSKGGYFGQFQITEWKELSQ